MEIYWYVIMKKQQVLQKNGKSNLITKIAEILKFMKMPSLTQLSYLVLPSSVVIHLVFIDL